VAGLVPVVVEGVVGEDVAHDVPMVFGATIGEVDVYPGVTGRPGVDDV